MKRRILSRSRVLPAALLLLAVAVPGVFRAAGAEDDPDLDLKVRAFLDGHRRQWKDMNIPAGDGEALYDLILERGYTRALEIGTSTGHSGIWMAWALSKTGGRLTTIEIDGGRHARALENFRASGVDRFIDALLGDAHDLVLELQGPFDFVFVDADKEWTTNYFKALAHKLLPGGCFASHNVGAEGVDDFLEYVKSLPGFETRIHPERGRISLSFKKSGP